MAFALHSTHIKPTTDPAGANPRPASLAVSNQDPIFGEYDCLAGNTGRGLVAALMISLLMMALNWILTHGNVHVESEAAGFWFGVGPKKLKAKKTENLLNRLCWLVEMRGIEPLTSALRRLRSPI